jgi:hypothetical protein
MKWKMRAKWASVYAEPRHRLPLGLPVSGSIASYRGPLDAVVASRM